MIGLSRQELRFAVVISSAHFSQHVYYRILPPLIPIMAVALDYPLWQLGIFISLYSIGMGIFQAPLGVISDTIDRRYLLPTGLAITGVAYVVFALAPSIGTSIPSLLLFSQHFTGPYLVMSFAMFTVGVGLAVVHPVGYPMVTDNVTPDNKGKLLGIFGASSKVGDATAPAFIALLILVMSWDVIILFFGVTGVIYGIILYVVLSRDEFVTTPRAKRVEETSVTSEPKSEPNRRSFLYPITVVYFFMISSMISTRGLNTFLPAFLVAVYGYSFVVFEIQIGAASIANVYFALLLLSGAAMQLVFGGLVDTYDARLILLVCMAIGTVGLVTLALVEMHPLVLFVIIVLLGAGLYGVNPARDALISDLSPPESEGRTFGYVFTAVSLSGAPIPAVIGYLLDEIGMSYGFLIMAIGPVLAGISIAFLYSKKVYQVDSALAESNDSTT